MRIIVIGLGSMGKRRIRLLKVIRPEADIVGVDSNEDRVFEVNQQFMVPCYSTIEEACQTGQFNCAFVCTSPLAHGQLIHECLLHDWNIFTEINLTDDFYQDNIELASKKEKKLFLSSTPIYRDEMRILLNRINGQKVSYRYHVGQYLPDWHPWEKYTDFFVGNKRTNGCREIMEIELPWMIRTFGKIRRFNVMTSKLSNLNINYNDTYQIQIEHETGTIGVLSVDLVCRKPVRKLEVYNEELYLEWNGKPDTLKEYNYKTKESVNICDLQYIHQAGYGDFINESAYMNELNAFFDVVENEIAIEYGFEDDIETLHIIDRIEGISHA